MLKSNHKIAAVFFLLSVTLLINSSSEESLRSYEIRLDQKGWGNGSPKDIEAVLYSACDSIYKHFSSLEEKEPIRVISDESGPITLFKRNLRGEIIVKLNTGDRFWCQYAYQMAHEFCHILCGFKNGSRRNLWFEETLCEMASMFALKSMAETWKTHPPYANWKSYSSAIENYLNDIELKNKLPSDTSLKDYYKKNAKTLSENAINRPMNGKVAAELLVAFETNPEHWASIHYINQGKAKKDISFKEYLKNWLEVSPKKHHIFIHSIARKLGISL